jgi:hypothetical protein
MLALPVCGFSIHSTFCHSLYPQAWPNLMIVESDLNELASSFLIDLHPIESFLHLLSFRDISAPREDRLHLIDLIVMPNRFHSNRNSL